MNPDDPTQPQDVPDQIAILVVDTRQFSKHDDRQQNALALAIPEVLRRASDRAQVPELWADRKFPDSTGDGYIIGFAPRLLGRVVNRYIECLEMELREAGSALPPGARLRMRMSLHVGPVSLLDDVRISSPVGKAMIDTHRLVDVAALRALLEHSDPDITHLAAALSERVVQDAVMTGYSGRQLTEFVKAPVEVKAKDFTGTAYLRVPAPSGELLAHGLLGVQPPPEDAVPAEPVPAPPTGGPQASAGGRATQFGDVPRGGAVGGDVSGSVGVLGSVSGNDNTIAGRDLHQNSPGRGSYHSGGDMNIGPYGGQRGDRTESGR